MDMKWIRRILGWVDYAAFGAPALFIFYACMFAFASGVMSAIKTLEDTLRELFIENFSWKVVAVLIFCLVWCGLRWKKIRNLSNQKPSSQI